MILLVLLFLAAQDLTSSARELARRIGRQDLSNLIVRNASSLSAAEVTEVKRTIELELRDRLKKLDGAAVIVTLSENVQELVWVAEVQDRDVVILNVVRPAAKTHEKTSFSIEKRLIWEQNTPILDLAEIGSRMVVLEPENVAFYVDRKLISSLPIPNLKPISRDPRGRLEISGDSYRALLPGLVCSGTVAGTTMQCSEIGSGIVPGRNYFTAPGLPPYFSSAQLPDTRIVATVDGRVQVDGKLIAGWGSDIILVESGCGRQVLASRPTEPYEPDAIQAYEIADGRATPVSDPTPFPGPVTALWPSGSQATAVARNLETGKYAAYSLSITCSR